MAVANVIPFQVTPGKAQEFGALIAEGTAIAQRVGDVTSVRLWQGAVGAAGLGGVTVVIEYENMEAYGRSVDALTADADWQALVAKFGATNVATPMPTQLVTELQM